MGTAVSVPVLANDTATAPAISGLTQPGNGTAPPGQTTTRFAFESVSAAGGSPTAGNFLDGVVFQTPPCPTTSKNA